MINLNESTAKQVDPERLRPFIGQWVALTVINDEKIIVGNGRSPGEAVKVAGKEGYRNPYDICLLLVPAQARL